MQKGKKLRIIRMLSICMAFLIFAGLAVSCGKEQKVKPIQGTKQELTVVADCGDYDVLYEELRYVAKNYQDIYEKKYGKDFRNNPELTAELTSTVLEKLTYNYAVLSLAKEVGITGEEKELKESVQSYIESLVEQLGGVSAYKQSLKDYYLTDHYVRFSTLVDKIETELYHVYTEDLGLIPSKDEEILDFFYNGGCIRTLHVFVENDEGESVEDNRALAQSVREKALAGESMTSLIGQYSEDYGMTTTKGYYFTYGEMEEDYEEAAMATEIGGVSEVVETKDGFYIIFRLEPEEEQILLNYQEMKRYYQYSLLNRFITERQKEMKVTLNETGAELDLASIE